MQSTSALPQVFVRVTQVCKQLCRRVWSEPEAKHMAAFIDDNYVVHMCVHRARLPPCQAIAHPLPHYATG